MEIHSHRNRRVFKEALAAIMVLTLLAPGLTAKERRGAEVVVVRKDGQVLQGELLAVKGNEIILMSGATSAEARESLANIQSVEKVPRKSKWLTGMIVGAIAGALVGAVASPKEIDPMEDDVALDKGSGALVGAVGYGLLGAAIGSQIKDKPIKIERTDPDYLAGIAAKLKKWARDRS